ncbi:large conductance mechanosensitive channel protein MscL [Sutterella sp.]|uniref:large conductance mechanosensitive channel protein MscL n=1 Tax=Sutterella sp. TaxID=1981025 RepID=UPI0026DF9021|nr:large conductance mechanosensitive channel protein MscL [Sutterella sp.]MDO5532971.1 large conductance mechanosensitive channel protein MscL [Sutterella sp.]
MRKFFQEFQAFISKGNVLDLAVAVIIGAAFSKIVDSLVKDIINPILGVLVGRPDFTNLFIVLKDAPEGYTGPQTYEALVKAGATVFGYGAFLTAVVQFLLLAFAVFWLIKIVVTARTRLAAEADRLLALATAEKKAEEEKAAAEAAKKAEEEAAAAAAAAAPAPITAEELKVLCEIRDLLKAAQAQKPAA